MLIAYHSSYNHPVPEMHRFPMKKYDDVYTLLTQSKLQQNIQLISPKLCPWEIITNVHDKEYTQQLIDKTLDKSHCRRIGFILDDAIIERERYIMDGTLQLALQAYKSKSYGFNIAGGTHHAFSDKGEGFCIFNDFGIAADYLIKENLCQKILIIDGDVHQGNGTAEIFQNNEDVFTFSMHGKNNFPFIKEVSDLDIELEDGTEDEEYLTLLKQSLEFIDRIFDADMIFYQCGVDILQTDKMGKLKVTPEGCAERDRMIFRYAKDRNTPIICALGGGYSTELSDIVQQHLRTMHIAYDILS